MTVKHLLEQKGRTLWTIDPDATVADALAKMAEKDIGSLAVIKFAPMMRWQRAYKELVRGLGAARTQVSRCMC